MEMILLIGIPASGKTTWCKKALPGHIRISLDEIRGHRREIEDQMIESEMQKGNNIVIDDTNLTKEIRQKHIFLAKRHGATVNAVFFDVDIQKAHRQNLTRSKGVPPCVLDKYEKQLEIPVKDEGFDFIQIMR